MASDGVQRSIRPHPKVSGHSSVRRKVWSTIGVVLAIFAIFGTIAAFMPGKGKHPDSFSAVFGVLLFLGALWLLWYGLSIPLDAEDSARLESRRQRRAEADLGNTPGARLRAFVRWVLTPAGAAGAVVTIVLAVLLPQVAKMAPVIIYAAAAAQASRPRTKVDRKRGH